MNNNRKMMKLYGLIKERLSNGLLCCLILLGAYLFEVYCSHLYVDAFSTSFYLFMWMTFFVGALLWTFRERNAQMLPSEVTDWQCIAAFLLITSDQLFVILPKDYQEVAAPVLSAYTLPVLIVGGIVVAGLIKLLTTLYRHLDNERRQSALQTQRIRELLNSTPSVQRDIVLVRRLIENKSISQLSASDYLLLIEGCRTIDPDLFVWLKELSFLLPPRDIVFCVLIRMHKTKQEILPILRISEGSYRTMISRFRKRLSIEATDLETFLREL